MGILRCGESHKPRRTAHVRRLGDEQQGAVLGVFPEGLGPVKRYLLNGAVSAVGRVRATKADEGFPGAGTYRRRRYIAREVALEVRRATVQTELSLEVRTD